MPVKILLVMPDARIHRLRLGPLTMSLREAPLTLTSLAALVPEELHAEITIADESVDRIPFERHFDLVGISCLTGTALRAYAIADRFRKQGAKVVLGGVHVTLLPKEAERHADILVTGFAESAWPELLRDFAAGRLKPRYHGGAVDLCGLPHPCRQLQKRFGYAMANTVFATRGCRAACDFCSVPAAGFGWQTRPVGEVIDEIRSLGATRFAFNDVNLIDDREYALDLLDALTPLRKRWGGLATTRVADDPELLELMERSGCQFLLIGFESISNRTLHAMGKAFNDAGRYRRVVDTLHAHRIAVQGCFVFGFDGDGPEVFDETVEVVCDLSIDIPRYAVYTPYPGTQAFERLARQGRLLHRHWTHYDTQHVVFQPARMTPEELGLGLIRAYEKTFSSAAVLRRVARSPHPAISTVGNLAYRLYVRRLKREGGRVLRPPHGKVRVDFQSDSPATTAEVPV